MHKLPQTYAEACDLLESIPSNVSQLDVYATDKDSATTLALFLNTAKNHGWSLEGAGTQLNGDVMVSLCK